METNGIIGKEILVIFEDGQLQDGRKHFSKKQGICTKDTEIETGIDNKHFIPKRLIVRTEVLR